MKRKLSFENNLAIAIFVLCEYSTKCTLIHLVTGQANRAIYFIFSKKECSKPPFTFHRP